MRLFLIIAIAFAFASCDSRTEKEKAVTGKWLMIYPDHGLLTTSQRSVYGTVQDSLMNIYGLRLIEFEEGGKFSEPDYLEPAQGEWDLYDDRQLVVKSKNAGFNLFIATFRSVLSGRLQVQQTIANRGDSLPLIWNLQKIKSGDDALSLFDAANNSWRVKPAAPESDEQVKARLVNMLRYYAVYFDLVARTANFFSPKKVPLPFSYYAHGIGIKAFEPGSKFASCFFNEPDARKAYGFLHQAQRDKKERYEMRTNYVEEYAQYFTILANTLEKN